MSANPDTLSLEGLHAEGGKRSHILFASDLTENFEKITKKIFSGSDDVIILKSFDLEKYLE